jgi:hypothetical protein
MDRSSLPGPNPSMDARKQKRADAALGHQRGSTEV